MRKTIIHLFCLLGLCLNSVAQTIDIDNVRYSFKGANAVVSKYLGGEGSCVIPDRIVYNGLDYTVTSIGSNAFYITSVTEVKLPETIVTINNQAFRRCKNLTKINLPSSLERIEDQVFMECISLTRLIIPASVNYVSDSNVFYGCNTLRTLIYLGQTPPTNWTATSMTYVPDKVSYSSPTNSINNAQIIEMITFGQNEFDYTGHAPSTTWTNNVEGYTVSLSMPTLSGEVGSHEEWIPATFTNGDESFSTKVVYRYTIKPVKLTAKVNNANRKYGDENPSFTCSYSGFVKGENESVLVSKPVTSTTATKTSDVGDYPITASGGSAKNYTFVYEPGTLTITKAPLTAKVNDETRQYGKDNPEFTITYTGLKNGESVPKWEEALKIETAATITSDVGTYDVTATGIPTNYSLSAINKGLLFVTQAPLSIKADNATRKYFETNPSFTYSCSGFLNGDNVAVLTKAPSFSTDATQTSDVGRYLITPNGAEAKNYAMSYKQGELTITKRQLKATSHSSRLYGEDNPLLPIEYDGFINSETEEVLSKKPVGTTTAARTSTVGEYPITVSGGEATNYYFVYASGVLTVTKAPLSAKVNDATKVYGARNPTFTIDYDGLKNNETAPAWTTKPTFQTEATQSSGVGSYTVKAINGVPTNYELGEITAGTLNITPAPLTINANDAARQYYSDNPTFNYTCNGFVNGDNENVLSPKLLLSTTATRTSNVGNYEIKVGEVSSPNYSISYVNGILTVTPRTLVASVGNYERLYNEENPAFEVKYDGFVGNEDENVLSAKATASTPATKTSDVGTYPINVTGASADNYTIDYTSGTLTIKKAEQAISWDQDLKGLKVGDQVELKAVATSGLPITYMMESDGAAELYTAGSKSFLDCLSNGQFLIRAIQEGNKNYYSSPRASCNVKIIGNADDDPVVTILQADNGSVSTQVSKGTIKTFTIIALEGWKIHSVSYDNEDVSDQLDSDGHFTTPAINSDATLNVVYEKDGEDAVGSIEASSVKIQATEFGIRVKDANVGEVVYVYTTDGVLHKSVKVQQSTTDIPLKSDDVYIVKVADKTLKLRH